MKLSKLKKSIFFATFVIISSSFSFSKIAQEEVFDSSLESPYLQNIQQLTYPSMGFERAGEAYFSPDSQTIIFQAVPIGKEHYQIYTMNLNEGIPRRVSTGEGACTCAYFRPDGKKIIFASSHSDPLLQQKSVKRDPKINRECLCMHKIEESAMNCQKKSNNYKWDFTPYMNVYMANPDGTQLTPLTTGPAYHAECAYSNDGSKIVFASNESGNMHIYTMNADGSNVRQVTYVDACYNGGPFFSPDGSQIIFRADRDKPDYLQIYSINTDGSDEKQLTFNNAVNWGPYWHPNGRVVAYATSIHGHRHYEIYLLNTENLVEKRLTHNATFDGLPVFNREGNKMLWTSKRGPDNTSQVFIADFSLPTELN